MALDHHPITHELNEHQLEAVAGPPGHYLILAGAGSGKTRVLVHRIAWLLTQGVCRPANILAVTFTNKAASEMRGRLQSLLQTPLHGLWVGTFHSICHRMLRMHHEAAGLPEGFQILDSDDQLRLCKKIHKELNLDESAWQPRATQRFIHQCKEQGRRANDVLANVGVSVYDRQMARLYEVYETVCQRSGCVDFTELLLRCLEMLTQNEALRSHYQARFSQLLVDEFQDTNAIQYRWLKLLAGDHGHVMAVGDDDQSIYSWRGALVENMRHFQRDFTPEPTVICLEQNYRSTGTILQAANAVIANNTDRFGKALWTEGKDGEPIALYRAFNEIDEARFVCDRIQQWVDQGGSFDDVAVLYRSNAQSRVLEEQLNRARFPYRIYGGLRFFERAEIKDALAYCRLILNPHDDTAFERVVNTPTRGLGQTTVAALRDDALQHHRSLWQTSLTMLSEGRLASRAATALTQFVQLIENLQPWSQHHALDHVLNAILEATGLIAHYQKDRSERGASKVENLEELQQAMQDHAPFDPNALADPDQGAPKVSATSPLQTFLADVALDAGEREGQDNDRAVQLMTLHAAKGLEFPLVLLVGLEEGLFPHQMAAHEEGRLEEERRLCYVGMTRAKDNLVLTYAEARRIHGKDAYQRPSRFLQEIPEDFLQEIRFKHAPSRSPQRSHVEHWPRQRAHQAPRTGPSTAAPKSFGGFKPPALDYRLGQRVMHERFGEGVVLSMEVNRGPARIHVRFQEGAKWLLCNRAKLQPIEEEI